MSRNKRSRKSNSNHSNRRQQTARNASANSSLAPPPPSRTRSARKIKQRVQANTEDILGIFGDSNSGSHAAPSHQVPPRRQPPRPSMQQPVPPPMTRQRSNSASAHESNPFDFVIASSYQDDDSTGSAFITRAARSDNTEELDAKRLAQINATARGMPIPTDTRYDDVVENNQPGFLQRFASQFKTGVDQNVSGHHTYSDTGAAKQSAAMASEYSNMTVGNVIRAGTLTGLAGAAHDAAVGAPHRGADRPRTVASVVRQKTAEGFGLLGSVIGTVPVAGAAGGFISGPAAGVAAYEQGHSGKNAAAIAARETAVGAGQGAIPVYGTVTGVAGVVDSFNKLMTPVNRAGSDTFVHNQEQRMEELERLAANTQSRAVRDQAHDKIRSTRKRNEKATNLRDELGHGADGVKRGLLSDHG